VILFALPVTFLRGAITLMGAIAKELWYWPL
jgi:hypothetical protein